MSEQQTTGFLEESPGVRSSKRLWGSVLLGLGVAILVAVAVGSIVWARNNVGSALTAGGILAAAGAGLLGFGTLFENIKIGGGA